MEKIKFETEDGSVDFYILSQTRISGYNYLLVSEDDEETESATVYILKDISSDDEEDARYVFVEEDEELEAVFKVFSEELEDEDIDLMS